MTDHPLTTEMPLKLLRRIDALCVRFEAALRAGRWLDPAGLLEQVPPEARAALLRELLLLELESRPSAEHEAVAAQWRQRFSEYLDAINAARATAAACDSIRREAEVEMPTATPCPATQRGAMRSFPWLPPDRELTLTYVALHADGSIANAPSEAHVDRLDRFTVGTELQSRYRLEEELGRGGMGQVFLAHDVRLSRPVAVKVMVPSEPVESQAEQSRLGELFADEARLGANLTHPGIATVFDYGFHETLPYTVFEYVPGESLRARLGKGRKWPLNDVLLFLSSMAQALDFAHGRRVVHRDLKPENIRVTPQGQFKILDLGLAREFDRQRDWRFAGTPAYASPEQAADRPCDGRTDQYALALIVYEMLTGRRPFESSDAADLLRMHQYQEPASLATARPDLTNGVCAALMRSLLKQPNRRYSSCEEFALAMGCQFLSAPAPLPELLHEADIRAMWGRHGYLRLIDADRALYIGLGRVGLWRPHLALSPDDLWVTRGPEIIRFSLSALEQVTIVLRYTSGLGASGILALEIHGPAGPCRQAFWFFRRAACQSFHEQLTAAWQRRKLLARRPPVEACGEIVTPVVLLRQRPVLPYQLLGPLEARGRSRRRAESGLLLRGAMAGADAVIDVREDRLSLSRSHRLTGIAVRSVDQAERMELRALWLEDELGRLGTLALILCGWLLFRFFISWWASVSLLAWIIDIFTRLALGRQHYWKLLGAPMRLEFAFVLVPLLVAAAVCVRRTHRWARPVALTFFILAAETLIAAVALCGGVALNPSGRVSMLAGRELDWDMVTPYLFYTFLQGIADCAQGGSTLLVGWRGWQLHQEYRRLLPDEDEKPRKLLGLLLTVLLIVVHLFVFGFLLRNTLRYGGGRL